MKYKIVFSYDGSAFLGYAKQPNLKTIQGELEKNFSWFSIFLVVEKEAT